MRIATALIIIAVLGLGVALHAQNVSLTPSVLSMASTAVAANCPAPVASTTVYCFAADKLQVSPNGGAYVVIWPAGGAAVPALTINGTTKTLPASFTVAVGAPSATITIGNPPIVTTAPVVTVQ